MLPVKAMPDSTGGYGYSHARKLLIVATIPETIEAFLLPYIKHLQDRGWQVDGMARGIRSSETCRRAFDQVVDAPWSRQPLDFRNFIRTPRLIQDLVSRENYSVVHTHTPVASFVTRFALRRFTEDLKIVYTAHGFHFYSGGPPVRNLIFSVLERLAGRWTDDLIVINREDFEVAKRMHLVRPGRLHQIPGIGVDTTRFNRREAAGQDAARLRAELSLPDSARLVTVVAEFIGRKRHEDAINALARLQNPHVHLLLAGSGERSGEIRALAKRLGLCSQVHFLGYRNDVPALLAASDVLLLPSLQEGLPRSILEAMSIGTPVVATRIRGVTDLLDDGAGVLVPVRSPAAIAEALDYLLSDTQASKRIADTAAARVRQYDLDPLLAWHERFYEQLLAGRRQQAVG